MIFVYHGGGCKNEHQLTPPPSPLFGYFPTFDTFYSKNHLFLSKIFYFKSSKKAKHSWCYFEQNERKCYITLPSLVKYQESSLIFYLEKNDRPTGV